MNKKAPSDSSRKKCPGRIATNASASIVPKPLLNPRIPADVLEITGTACASGKWMLAVWRVEDGKLFLNRTATNFPSSDIDQAMRMLVEDVQQLKVK